MLKPCVCSNSDSVFSHHSHGISPMKWYTLFYIVCASIFQHWIIYKMYTLLFSIMGIQSILRCQPPFFQPNNNSLGQVRLRKSCWIKITQQSSLAKWGFDSLITAFWRISKHKAITCRKLLAMSKSVVQIRHLFHASGQSDVLAVWEVKMILILT